MSPEGLDLRDSPEPEERNCVRQSSPDSHLQTVLGRDGVRGEPSCVAYVSGVPVEDIREAAAECADLLNCGQDDAKQWWNSVFGPTVTGRYIRPVIPGFLREG